MLVAALTLLASCKGCDEAPKVLLDDAGAERAAPAAAPPNAAEAVTDGAAKEVVGVDAAPSALVAPSPCRLVYGPAAQPFRGPAALAVAEGELRLVVNDAGRPRLSSVAIPPPKATDPPPRSSVLRGRWPPCALAGRFAYCQAPDGAVVRAVLGGAEPGEAIAKSRSGTRIAAAPLGGGHAVVAFLDVRRTTEGEVLQAFVALDDRAPVRLSEDGAGATTLAFLSRGASAVAVYLDARTAMVPVHARPVSLKAGELALGRDAVVFVGGAPERGIDVAAASVGARGFAFVPMPRGVLAFGVAAIPIDDPPNDDVEAVWSPYPNGLDPAPIAAASARDGDAAWVLRVRPRGEAASSRRVLELGEVDVAGAFTSLGEIAPADDVTDVALVEDGARAVWLLYGGGATTWLERRVCPTGGGRARP